MKDKIKGKMDRHYPITVNGRKCRILGYKTDGSRLTIITKISSCDLLASPNEKLEIVIESQSQRHIYVVQRENAYCGISVFRYYYTILDERVEPSSVQP